MVSAQADIVSCWSSWSYSPFASLFPEKAKPSFVEFLHCVVLNEPENHYTAEPVAYTSIDSAKFALEGLHVQRSRSSSSSLKPRNGLPEQRVNWD